MASLRLLADATVHGYSAVLFSSRRTVAAITFTATLLSPAAGLMGFLGAVLSGAFALFVGAHDEKVRGGLYSFNGLLVGLAVSLYHQPDAHLVVMLVCASMLLVLVTLALDYMGGYFLGVPILSVPFVIVTMILYLALFNYGGFLPKTPYVSPLDAYFPELPPFVLYYFRSLGAIFFQSSPWAGVLVACGILVYSRIGFLLSIAGFIAGAGFHFLLLGSVYDVSTGMAGFNYILTAMAVGGVLLVPSPNTFVLGIAAAVMTALFASAVKIFFIAFNLPVLAAPFTMITLGCVYGARLLHGRKFRVVDFTPDSPETNLDYFKTRQERFGETGLDIRLPFSGVWTISQGYSGKFTHQNLWKESLDFMAVGENGSVRKGESNQPEDFYTFGLPVLAPAAGRVVKTVSHIADNKNGEINTQQNWGNLIILQHSPYLYSQISHLKRDSLLVKEGDYVTVGTRIALAGNSGRSVEPHIHMHFQAVPEIGSATLALPFTQYVRQAGTEAEVCFKSIPKEGEMVGNVLADFNIRSRFTFAPGQKIEIEAKRGERTINETWTAGVDFVGNLHIEDKNGNRLNFFPGADFFAALDYRGKTSAPLFALFIAAYRIPFSGSGHRWRDTISYKYFASLAGRMSKDLVLPFSDRVFYRWEASHSQNENGSLIESNVRNGRWFMKSELLLQSNKLHIRTQTRTGTGWEIRTTT